MAQFEIQARFFYFFSYLLLNSTCVSMLVKYASENLISSVSQQIFKVQSAWCGTILIYACHQQKMYKNNWANMAAEIQLGEIVEIRQNIGAA